MFKIVEQPLPSCIDEDELRALRKQAALRRKITEEVEKQMGLTEAVDSKHMSFDEWLKSLPQDIDVDDSIFARHAVPGDRDVFG